MRICDLIKRESINLDGNCESKEEVVDECVQLMARTGNLSDVKAFRESVLERERQGTTGVGEGLALPHGKCEQVKRPGISVLMIRDGVEYEALDGKPVTLVFMIASPLKEDKIHVEIVSRLSVLLMDEDFTANLRTATSPNIFLSLMEEAERTKFPEEVEGVEEVDEDQVRLTGIRS